MKKLSLLMIMFAYSIITSAQIVINIEPGITVSRQSFIYTNSMIGLSAFAGVEYLDIEITRDIDMNLNSNIGYIQKGGKFKDANTGMFSDLGISESSFTLNYISINTTADFKYPINKTVLPFIGIGPYLDVLIGYNSPNQFYETEKPRTFNGGALVDLGVKYIYDNYQFGFKFNYFIGLNQTSSWLEKSLWTNSFSLGIVAGYRFK